jgi:outer membrane receptor protein involved in Fe transport
MRCKNWFLSGCAVLSIAGLHAAPAFAQGDTQAQSGEVTNEGDIIVTARRRDETAQETPVALTVLNDALLERYGVRGVASIQSLTPGLYTGESSGAMGGTISLRGVGSGDSMAFIDQAVSANVDGVPISSAQILRAAQMDLKQIEVLRGPQALFFGKNSPGGIISLTTADPGERTEGLLRAGYEFTAREKYVEGMFATPLSDTVGLRLAGRYSKMDGYIRVISPALPNTIPMDINRFPKQDEIFLRGTVVWNPSDRVSVRLKATTTDTYMVGGSSQYSDVTACPYGTPQRPGEDASNCRNDGKVLLSQLSPAFLALSPYLTNPNGSRKNTQTLLSAQIDYELSDALKLTSVSGYYKVHERLTSNGGYGPYSNNGFAVRFNNAQYSQELRLASDFGGSINFLLGGFYEERKLYTLTMIGTPFGAVPTPPPAVNIRLPIESTHQKQLSYSGFGQLLFDPTEQIQVTLGGRYTHEVKNLLDYTVIPATPAFTPGNVYGAPVDATQLPGYGTTRKTFNNFSPEATVTYKPTGDVMVFASYKRGFKSGGFDAGYTAGAILTPARLASGQLFRPEKVEGVEAGLKSMFADRQLTFNLTGYWYDYKGLQVPTFDTIAQAFRLQNAASARVRGLEAELRYRPSSLPGLSLHATGAYNDAKFRAYLSDCYQGQTVALGCSVFPNAAGVFTQQDLSGRRLRKAPKFAATFGGYYETPVSDGLLVGLSVDGSYSGSYIYGTNYQPLTVQNAYAKVDATLRLFSEDKRWELAVIGRNLTDKRSLINGIDRTGTGSGKGTTRVPCTTSGPTPPTTCAALSDILGTPTMPRTIAVQATFKY